MQNEKSYIADRRGITTINSQPSDLQIHIQETSSDAAVLNPTDVTVSPSNDKESYSTEGYASEYSQWINVVNPSRLSSFLKRTLDLLIIFVGFPIYLSTMLLIALAVRLDSSGPVIFWQERIGRDGRQFRIAKFRSMLEQAECDGPKFACQVEGHITSVGRFLRKFHLDELPQLWNVLKGEMSLVGPRPEQPEFVQQYSQSIPLYQYRHIVKPGITGWAQIKRGYTSDIEGTKEKLWFDLNYISQLSFRLDIKILLLTFVVVIAQSDNGRHLASSSTEPRGIYVNLCPGRVRSKKSQPFLRFESAMEVEVLDGELS